MMDCVKTGNLILKLRKEKNMTQKDVAEKLHISDKTVSKWERGLGCPDIAILKELAKVLEVNIETLLSGDMPDNNIDGGNMKRTKFYVCKECGNIITSTNDNVSMSCCGKPLTPLDVKKDEDGKHKMEVEIVDNEYYVHTDHEMSKQHYIGFIAYLTGDKLNITRLYPEMEVHVRFMRYGKGFLYVYCNNHGLYRQLI